MAVEVYGVDADYVQSFMQISVSATSAITDAQLTVIVRRAASKFNGIVHRAGFSPTDDIASDTATDLYSNAAGIVFEVARPFILGKVHGTAVVATDMVALTAEVNVLLRDIRARPQILGEVPAEVSPRVRSSTEALGLNTDDTARDNRRIFDTVTDRSSGGVDDIYRN